jgi:alpha-tubulin suppressor-like RCC1 family protein
VVIGAGTTHACALDNGGHLYCWGYGPHGQIGDGGHAVSVPVPIGPRASP